MVYRRSSTWKAVALAILTAACIAGAAALDLLRVPTAQAQTSWCNNGKCVSPTTCQYASSTSCSFSDARSCTWRMCAFVLPH